MIEKISLGWLATVGIIMGLMYIWAAVDLWRNRGNKARQSNTEEEFC